MAKFLPNNAAISHGYGCSNNISCHYEVVGSYCLLLVTAFYYTDRRRLNLLCRKSATINFSQTIWIIVIAAA